MTVRLVSLLITVGSGGNATSGLKQPNEIYNIPSLLLNAPIFICILFILPRENGPVTPLTTRNSIERRSAVNVHLHSLVMDSSPRQSMAGPHHTR